ncbi:MAG: hypothetical protein NDJ89_05680 [Oligoflexia bacterium]|nr:hypothetical protein [Oligoflexia bacterium]
MNEGLILSAKGLSGKNATLDFPPTISGVLGRFLGAPVATLYLIVEFSEDRLGLLHSYGFTLLKSGRFCKTVRTNPNHALSYGVSADGRHALLFSAGRASSVDRAVEGWRSLDESLLCGA